MKIVKKVKMPKVTCISCGCEYIPNKKDLQNPVFSFVKCMARCPICNTENIVFNPKRVKQEDYYKE